MFVSARNRYFLPKEARKNFPGFFRISGFHEFFSRSGSIQEIFKRKDAEENPPSAGINIRMKKIFEFKENRDSSPFF